MEYVQWVSGINFRYGIIYKYLLKSFLKRMTFAGKIIQVLAVVLNSLHKFSPYLNLFLLCTKFCLFWSTIMSVYLFMCMDMHWLYLFQYNIFYSIIPGTQTIYLKTWGCTHNTSDSEYMAGQLAAYGYKITG